MNQNGHKHHLYDFFEDEHIDDYSALNYLLEHVRGLFPSSLRPEFALDEDYDGYELE